MVVVHRRTRTRADPLYVNIGRYFDLIKSAIHESRQPSMQYWLISLENKIRDLVYNQPDKIQLRMGDTVAEYNLIPVRHIDVDVNDGSGNINDGNTARIPQRTFQFTVVLKEKSMQTLPLYRISLHELQRLTVKPWDYNYTIDYDEADSRDVAEIIKAHVEQDNVIEHVLECVTVTKIEKEQPK